MRLALWILACVAVVAACEDPEAHHLDALQLQEVVCQDERFSIAYMVRLPHEPHSAERCVQVATRSSARFVPDVSPFLSSPVYKAKEAAR